MESVARNDLFGVKPPPDARRCVFRREPWSKIPDYDAGWKARPAKFFTRR